MLKRINKLNADDPMTKSIIEAIAAEHSLQKKDIEQVLKNLFFDTCSLEMLEFYEKECGITEKAKSEEDRRSAVEARWKSEGKCDIALLQMVADSWQYGKTTVDYKSSKLIVTFIEKGIPTDIEGLKAALEETKPAHIPIEYIFTYNTWADLKLKTWGELKTGTWAEAKVR